MKTYGGNGSVALRIFNLDIRWNLVSATRPNRFTSNTQWIGSFLGPKRFWRLWDEENPLVPTKNKTPLRRSPAPNSFSTQTELSRLLLNTNTCIICKSIGSRRPKTRQDVRYTMYHEKTTRCQSPYTLRLVRDSTYERAMQETHNTTTRPHVHLPNTPKKNQHRDSRCTIKTVKTDIHNHLELFIHNT
jgi:hypothetical protein